MEKYHAKKEMLFLNTARCNMKMKHIILMITVVVICIQPCYAQHNLPDQKKNTLEFGGSADFVNNGFGNWYAGKIKYTKKASKQTFFLETTYLNREKCGGDAVIPAFGLYWDWSPRFYTFSSVSKGTEAWYSPKIRADLDLNFKLGEEKKWVLTFGGNYIDFYSEQKAAIGSAALTYYGKGFVLSDRLFFNTCFPGKKTSLTNTLSIDQGYANKYYNTFTASYGNQSYQTLDWGNYTDVSRKAYSLSFTHRNWVKKNWGLVIQINYVSVSNAYDITGINLGTFWTF